MKWRVKAMLIDRVQADGKKPRSTMHPKCRTGCHDVHILYAPMELPQTLCEPGRIRGRIAMRYQQPISLVLPQACRNEAREFLDGMSPAPKCAAEPEATVGPRCQQRADVQPSRERARKWRNASALDRVLECRKVRKRISPRTQGFDGMTDCLGVRAFCRALGCMYGKQPLPGRGAEAVHNANALPVSDSVCSGFRGLARAADTT